MNMDKEFRGFPTRTNYTPIPNSFFSALLPKIDDIAELKVTLYIFWALYRRRNYPKFITYSELRADEALMIGISRNRQPDETLHEALDKAVERGMLLSLKIEKEGQPEEMVFLNNEQGQRAVIQIETGEIPIDGIIKYDPANAEEKPNIYTLYEQHIGLLTPMVAEDLKEAENIYPASWIEDAFYDAVSLNKRSWRYIQRILERWASEGKDDGRTGQDSKKDLSPEEYIRKYGNLSRK